MIEDAKEIIVELKSEIKKYQKIKSDAVTLRDRIFDGFDKKQKLSSEQLQFIKKTLQDQIHLIKHADKSITGLEKDISVLMLDIWEHDRRSPTFERIPLKSPKKSRSK